MKASHPPADSTVLVAVVNQPEDLARALQEGWYRIPLARAPARIGVEYLAFYQTGAFPEDERWLIRWYAPVTDYRIVHRRELLPEEPDHPRANDRYYRISVGPGIALTCPVPSRRLRRIAFIPTTLTRLVSAHEINDLWIKTGAQERLWQALLEAELDAECNFEIAEGPLAYTADFVLPCRTRSLAVSIELATEWSEPIAQWLHEEIGNYQTAVFPDWIYLHIPASIIMTSNVTERDSYIKHLKNLVENLGGLI